ncbi:MAG: hypothetical protein V1706_11860 [Pseudomonadota bacterium]
MAGLIAFCGFQGILCIGCPAVVGKKINGYQIIIKRLLSRAKMDVGGAMFFILPFLLA